MSGPPVSDGEDATTAFVGVAKNSGKTTALGRWADELAGRAVRAGLVSIGVDGEPRDAIFGIDKPAVPVAEGSWVVAGSEALDRSSARFEYIEGLGFSTPLGAVYLARAIDDGDVVLGGLRHRRDLLEAREAIRAAADGDAPLRILIDGAYGRSVAADGRVADEVVVATGAAVAETPEEVVDATERLVDSVSLAGPAPSMEEVGKRAEAEGRALFATPEGAEPMPKSSALLGLPAARGDWPEETTGVAVPGAVTDGVIEELVRVDGAGRELVVMAPAAVQASAEAWRALRGTEWEVRALHPVALVGIAANPADPTGGSMSRTALTAALSDRWPSVPVFDARRS